jgi:putative transferase (TIGR04331 family)
MFLITTADQRFWKTDRPILFLGEWCKLFAQKPVWEKLSYEVMPYHWDNREALYKDYLYLDALYEKVLDGLSRQLNNIHGTNHSFRYWRIIVGPWLYYFCQILYDRYLSISSAVKSGKVSDTLVGDYGENEWLPNNFYQFSRWFIEDSYNQFLYSYIIRCTQKIPHSVIKVEPEQSPADQGSPNRIPLLREILCKTGEAYKRNIPNRFNRIILALNYLRRCDLLRLQLSLHQFPSFHLPAITNKRVEVEMGLRKNIGWEKAGNEFEEVLNKMIQVQIPMAYLEAYSEIEKFSLRIFPKNPEVIVNEVLFFSNDIFKFWAAHHIEHGAKFAGIQHGGLYGIGLWNSDEKHEISIYDRFYSWGWKLRNCSVVKPLPAAKLNKVRKCLRPRRDGRILLVLGATPRYSYHMCSSFVSSTGALSYFLDQYRFVRSLCKESRSLLLARLYIHDYGWDQMDRWKSEVPGLECYRGTRPIIAQLKESRLCVATYNSTTYIETFAANFPTVLFWNPNHWELRASAQQYFDDIRNAGILHDTPEAAARKVNDIYQDPIAWWHAPRIQEAKNRFCSQFACTSPHWLGEWKKEILDLKNSK